MKGLGLKRVNSSKPTPAPFLPESLGFIGATDPGAGDGDGGGNMSYAAFKTTHRPTGIENCGGGFITHSPADFVPTLPAVQTDDLDSDWPDRGPADVGPVPNLVVTAGNVLEVYLVRVFEEADSKAVPRPEARRGGVVAGIAGASLELVCHYR